MAFPSDPISLDEAAYVLGISRRTLNRWVAAGAFGAVFRRGRLVRLSRAAVLGLENDPPPSPARPCGGAGSRRHRLLAARQASRRAK